MSDRPGIPAWGGLRATWVIARRDFVAVLFSKAFVFFLLGPLLPLVVGALAGGIGARVERSLDRPELGLAMAPVDTARMLEAHRRLAGRWPGAPDMVVVARLAPGERFDARAALARGQLAAILTGSIASPRLVGPPERIDGWAGPVSLLAASARSGEPAAFPEVRLTSVKRGGATTREARLLTAQSAQMLLFLLTMLLAGMVLSNLVEEKGNKIIEVLAAAIPLDALFLGKLFAMLGVSLVGIALWLTVAMAAVAAAGSGLAVPFAPAVGWPVFLLLGLAYFAMAYLLLGSLFLSIGSLAATVREVQTLSMPVTMVQLLVFFLASYALSQPGGAVEWLAMGFPLSSPFAMLARAAQSAPLWPHALALAWQAAWVALTVKAGAAVFRRAVMKSGPAQARSWRSRVGRGRRSSGEARATR